MNFKSDKPWNQILLDEPCYKEELADDDEPTHTKQDLIDYCNGNMITAERLFYSLEWQSPHTLLDEWFIEGELDDKFNLTGGQ